jgi:tRNA A37 threonylcarbamoyltransferase TsaD
MTMSVEEMSGIIDPTVEKVVELTRGQIRNTRMTVQTVLLVGGFGQNNYLKERLRDSLGPTI